MPAVCSRCRRVCVGHCQYSQLTDTALLCPNCCLLWQCLEFHARTFLLSASLSVGLRSSFVKTLYSSGEAGGGEWRDWEKKSSEDSVLDTLGGHGERKADEAIEDVHWVRPPTRAVT